MLRRNKKQGSLPITIHTNNPHNNNNNNNHIGRYTTPPTKAQLKENHKQNIITLVISLVTLGLLGVFGLQRVMSSGGSNVDVDVNVDVGGGKGYKGNAKHRPVHNYREERRKKKEILVEGGEGGGHFHHGEEDLMGGGGGNAVVEGDQAAEGNLNGNPVVKGEQRLEEKLNALPYLSSILKNTEIVALYFAASWCPMSTPVTQKLVEEFHVDMLGMSSNGVAASEDSSQLAQLEIVYVSSDDNADEAQHYISPEWKWRSVPFEADERTEIKRYALFLSCFYEFSNTHAFVPKEFLRLALR